MLTLSILLMFYLQYLCIVKNAKQNYVIFYQNLYFVYFTHILSHFKPQSGAQSAEPIVVSNCL